MSPKCPPVTLNVDEIVEAAKDKLLKSCPSFIKNGDHVEADVHSVGIRGLGRIALVEPQVNANQFVMGFVTIPSVVNFATKLMQVGIFLPQADMAVSRGVAAGLTLVGTLISGGKSFLLGAFLGQFPTTLDAIADVAIAGIMKSKGVPPIPPASPNWRGMGDAEGEIAKLREDLKKLSGMGTSTEYAGERIESPEVMSGVRFYH
jgi:hypothetical protein